MTDASAPAAVTPQPVFAVTGTPARRVLHALVPWAGGVGLLLNVLAGLMALEAGGGTPLVWTLAVASWLLLGLGLGAYVQTKGLHPLVGAPLALLGALGIVVALSLADRLPEDATRRAYAVEHIWLIVVRELRSYFASPIAYVFMTVFLVLAGYLTLYGSPAGTADAGFFARGRADLVPFFSLLPWLFLFIVPAVTMRLWAEETQTGSIELLATLPIRLRDLLLGKFLGAWAFTALMLGLTFPLAIVVGNYGEPDVGQILASYGGALLLAGAFLAIGACFSSLTRNQIVAFISSVFVSGVFVLIGGQGALTFLKELNPAVAQFAAGISLAARFDSISRGVLDLGDVAYSAAFMGFFLYLNHLALSLRQN